MKKLTYRITETQHAPRELNENRLTDTYEISFNVFFHNEQSGGKALLHHADYSNPLKTFNSRKEMEDWKSKFTFPAHWLQEELEMILQKAKDDEKHLLQEMMKEMENDNRVIRWVKEAMNSKGITDFPYEEEKGVVEYHDYILAGDPISIIAEIDIDEFLITRDKYRYNGIDEYGDHAGTYDIGIEDDEWDTGNYWDIWNDEYHMKSSEIKIKISIL
jgi:hypothetical protein